MKKNPHWTGAQSSRAATPGTPGRGELSPRDSRVKGFPFICLGFRVENIICHYFVCLCNRSNMETELETRAM